MTIIKPTVVELSVFSSRLSAVCDEMGARLQRSALSPNIKDRLDYSCAIFSAGGELIAQAAHIPVHLGSMAFAMRDLVDSHDWQPGDAMVLNDPYLGGTHLPDVTFIAPVFVAQSTDMPQTSNAMLVGFVANRAHHANIGATEPGSMPISTTLEEEGVVIPPSYFVRAGRVQQTTLQALCGLSSNETPSASMTADFFAQLGTCQLGVGRLTALVEHYAIDTYQAFQDALFDYAETLALRTWSAIPNGVYRFQDFMDDDGCGQQDIPISVALTIQNGEITADFTGTADQVHGNINCPLSVVAAAVYYVFRCLLPSYAPSCAGTFRPIHIAAPKGSLVNAKRPAAVAAGNVETSSRIVDCVLGALSTALPERIPAASQGTMNNLAMGAVATDTSARWDYYETLGGGGGAGPAGIGASGNQTHMTNTLNTPVESIEQHYPVRVTQYQLRRGSGGQGDHRGGDGVERVFEFLGAARVSLLTERRTHAPWGLWGGEGGSPGVNTLNNTPLGPKSSFDVRAGDQLKISTPGGGGWNSPSQSE